MDLVCDLDGEEIIIRAKLARNDESRAVSIAESVSHSLLSKLGFRMAEPYIVQIGNEFAADLSKQYGFDSPIQAGRHWGTRLIGEEALNMFDMRDAFGLLHQPKQLFLLYLADVVLANKDRKTKGNVLIVRRPHSELFDLVPIDQSESFFHPRGLLLHDGLLELRDRRCGQYLDGTENVVLENGNEFIAEMFKKIEGLQGFVSDFVSASTEEWYDRTGVDPGIVERVLAHRIRQVSVLADRNHWESLCGAVEGGHVLDFKF